MSDILPVRLQDFLYSRKSELRKNKIITCVKKECYRQRLKKPLLDFLRYKIIGCEALWQR